MLRSVKQIENYHAVAVDGDVGTVHDVYFDDERWTIRYLVTDTGSFWQGPHRVLISPNAFRAVDWGTQSFHLALTRDKVRNSPSFDSDKPISRQYEIEYARYYEWPSYWTLGAGWFPANPLPDRSEGKTGAPSDPHLQSIRGITGYRIQGSDGEIGHVDDVIVDDVTWAIRYLVVDTRNWWFGKKVLIAPLWADRVSWEEQKVYVDLPRQLIKDSPAWHPDAPVNRDYEARLFDYYGRPAYWASDVKEEPPHVMAPYEKQPTP